VEAGTVPLRGDLSDVKLLARAAAEHDGVIHAGFSHDNWGDMDDAFAQDANAVEAMLDALAGSNRPFSTPAAQGVLADTGTTPADERAMLSDAPMLASRIGVEQAVIAAASRGVRSVVVRPGLVYGGGGGGTVGMLLDLAVREGGPFVIGDGWNVWSAVHRDDLGALYVAAFERAPAGSMFNVANDDRVNMREIAAAASRAAGRGGPLETIPLEAARQFAGGMADGLVAEKRISARHAREALGWTPSGPSITEEIERGSYAAALADRQSGGRDIDKDGALTMINAFEVPADAADGFVTDWLTDLDFMVRQPGFVRGTLYEADAENARFRFVNVAHWRERQDFERAQAGMMERFKTEKLERVSD
jgi:nucleoside-diphosphate-sugar epimerase/heme-degrading monooxygenase HmoA